ncbi:MAG: hypothetical protein ACE5JR_04005 [Gemmatimonadota bacterium]
MSRSNRSGGSAERKWKRFGWFLAAGAALVFLNELVHLIGSLSGLHERREQGAVWAILLMILAIVVTVGVIGGGLAWSIRRSLRDAPEEPPGPEGEEDPE